MAYDRGNRVYGFALNGRMILGLAIMVLGALWTLDNLNLVESEPILRWWPLVLVTVGAAKLLGLGTTRHVAAGGLIGFAGVWALADSLGLVHISIWDLWPVALVAIGVAMLSRSAGWQRGGGAPDEPSARLNTFAFMSGVGRKVISQEFRGGEVTAVMGGAEIDLRPARPAAGGAVIDVFAWWGGIDLFIPDDWKVVSEATVIMGAIEDTSKAPPPDTRNVLIVRGFVMMGGVEIKN